MTLRENINIFLRRVEQLETYDDNDSDGYKKEFKKITTLSKRLLQEKHFPATVGELQYNLCKNRYKDILPYDHSRVVLSEIEERPGSDYINASFIKDARGKATYIASQGPQPNTVNDFWRMLWQYDVHVVIMACNEYEGLKMKCKRYWPSEAEDLEFGGIFVHLVEEQHFDEFIVRILQATCENHVRLIYQLHYTSWPDHGTPTNLDQILDMIALARQYQSEKQSHIVVHCSAGCGRTGTILSIDFAWNLLKDGNLDPKFSIFELVKHFRTQRQSIVQSEDQYVFVHMAVKELFQRHLLVMDEHFYENVTTLDGVCMQETSDEIYQNVDDSVTKHGTEKDTFEVSESVSNATGTTGNEYLEVLKASPQENCTNAPEGPPLPPPKPERLFFKDSPTKATIEQTVTRLLSETDVETEAYTNASGSKSIHLDMPKGKDRRNKDDNLPLDKKNATSTKYNIVQAVKPGIPKKPASHQYATNSKTIKMEAKMKDQEIAFKPSLTPKPINNTNNAKSVRLDDYVNVNVGTENASQEKTTKTEKASEVHNGASLSKASDSEIVEKCTGAKTTTETEKRQAMSAVDNASTDITQKNPKFVSHVTEGSMSTTMHSARTPSEDAEYSEQKPFLEENSLYDDNKTVENLITKGGNDDKMESVLEIDGNDDSSVFDSDDDLNPPEIPKKNFYSSMLEEKTSVAVTFKGTDISFGRRVRKPNGPREQQTFIRTSSGKSA